MSDAITSRIPRYGKHRATGHARVVLNGRSFYLGKHGSPESMEAYRQLIQEWLARGRQLPKRGLTVTELILAFWKHAQVYYRKPDGRPTAELHCIRLACRPLKDLYGITAAAAFGAQEFKTVRQAMIAKGWVRKSINRHLERIRRMYRWAGEQGIVPPEVYHRLLCVAGLKLGRTEAKEGEPVRPVPEVLIDAVKPLVWSPVRAMIELQLLTGMRPGEVCQTRRCDLETSCDVWIYRPPTHKTEHFGHAREVYLGPQAQEVIRPFLKSDLHAFLFSPKDARDEHFRVLRARRTSKVQPSQVCRKRTSPRKLPGDSYTVTSYRRAVARACDQAFPLPAHLAPRILPSGKRETAHAWRARLTATEIEEIKAWRGKHRWHPHQLRHNAGTRLRKQYGIELARIILGHSTAFTTEIYAEQDRDAAREVMAKIG